MKQKILSSIVTLIAMLLVATFAAGVVYENNYGKITVTPDTAFPHSEGIVQYAEFCSKVASPATIGLSFLFPQQLVGGRIQYDNGARWVDVTDEMTYANINLRNFGYDSDKQHAYFYDGISFSSLECKNFRWTYTSAQSTDKWDMALWAGTLANPTRQWLLDPYYNNTWYRNAFTSVDDLSDIDATSSYNVSYTTGMAYLTNNTGGSITQGIVHYWNLDSTGAEAQAADSLAISNWTLVKTGGTWVNGVLGNAIDVTNKDQFEYTFTPVNENDTYTMTFFAQKIGVNPVSVCLGNAGTEYLALQFHSGDAVTRLTHTKGGVSTSLTSATLPAGGNWGFYAIQINHTAQTAEVYSNISGGGLSILISGALIHGSTTWNEISIGDSTSCLSGGAHEITIDEIGYWDRNLTIEELGIVYNAGLGESYPFASVIAANATYGELYTKNIPSVGAYTQANCSFLGDYNTGNEVNVSLSNDGGTTWVQSEVYPSITSGTYLCGGVTFPSSDSTLKANITLNNIAPVVDFHSAFIEQFDVSFLDWASSVTLTDLNYSLNVAQGQYTSFNLTLNVPSSDVFNVTTTFSWNGTSGYVVDWTNASDVWFFNTTIFVPAFAEGENVNVSGFFNVSVQTSSDYFSTVYSTFQEVQVWLPQVQNITYSTLTGFFTGAEGNLSLLCNNSNYDQVGAVSVGYNISLNGEELLLQNASSLTMLDLNGANFTNGANVYRGTCFTDFASDYREVTIRQYLHEYFLIDERTGDAFDYTNLSSMKLYFDDNNTLFDFKVNVSSSVNYTTSTQPKLRFELGYNDGTFINRYIDASILPVGNVRVCANKHDITYYNQYLVSSAIRPVLMKSVFADCLVAADYTRFAYQNAFLLPAKTIDMQYYVYVTKADGTVSLLSSIAGTVESNINIDSLEFYQNRYNVSLVKDVLSFQVSDVNPSIVQIHYRNDAFTNVLANFKITRFDTGAVLVDTTDTSSPNDYTIMFDTSLYGENSSVLYKVVVTSQDASGTVGTITRYFNNAGKTGILNSQLALFLGVMFLIFALVLVSAQSTFGWFGIVMCIADWFILGLATPTWYIILVQAMSIIIGLYIAIVMFSGGNKTMVGA